MAVLRLEPRSSGTMPRDVLTDVIAFTTLFYLSLA